ncbi:MAG: isoprenylcysteine carboxylmethyltransferase family protein [Clostridiales bacterium]|nr:isoprenylcysteine carboxylmethyltransferase family protein [Clostridiales bacterium]
MQTNLSIIAFLALLALLAFRAVTLRRKGIRAIVFGKTDKSDFLLVLLVVWLVYPALAKVFGLPMWGLLVQPLWEADAPGWAGLALCVIALAGFAASLISFGDSFRVGIDEEKPARLVTTGMFAISRNPVYLCIILFLLGMFLVHRNIVIIVGVIVFLLAVHRQILREEAFLKVHYGSEYEEYCRKTRRYL